MTDISLLNSGNLQFLESVYEQYRADPDSVSEHWRAYFAGFDAGSASIPRRGAPAAAAAGC